MTSNNLHQLSIRFGENAGYVPAFERTSVGKSDKFKRPDISET